MDYVSLKQFADDQGISYEAVRRQVNRYSDQLSGHIIKQSRVKGGQLLDQWAVDFLKERRRASPIVFQTIDQGEQIGELTAQVDSLKAQLMSAQNKLLEAQERIIKLQDEAKQMLVDHASYTALLEDNEAKTKMLQEAEEQLQQIQKEREEDLLAIKDLQDQRDQALRESQSFHRSWFGFYRKL